MRKGIETCLGEFVFHFSQEAINRIFQVQTPMADFVVWVERNLPAVQKAIDGKKIELVCRDVPKTRNASFPAKKCF